MYSNTIIIDKSLRTSWNNYRDSAGPTIINYSVDWPNGYRGRGFRTPKMQNAVATYGSTMSSHVAGLGIDVTSPNLSQAAKIFLAGQHFDYICHFGTNTLHANNTPYNIHYSIYGNCTKSCCN